MSTINNSQHASPMSPPAWKNMSICWTKNTFKKTPPVSSWWFQPICKIWSSKWTSSPSRDENSKNIWNHHLGIGSWNLVWSLVATHAARRIQLICLDPILINDRSHFSMVFSDIFVVFSFPNFSNHGRYRWTPWQYFQSTQQKWTCKIWWH